MTSSWIGPLWPPPIIWYQTEVHVVLNKRCTVNYDSACVLTMRPKGRQWFNTLTCNDHSSFISHVYNTLPSIKRSQRLSPKCNVGEIPVNNWCSLYTKWWYFSLFIFRKHFSLHLRRNLELLIITYTCYLFLVVKNVYNYMCLWHDYTMISFFVKSVILLNWVGGRGDKKEI